MSKTEEISMDFEEGVPRERNEGSSEASDAVPQAAQSKSREPLPEALAEELEEEGSTLPKMSMSRSQDVEIPAAAQTVSQEVLPDAEAQEEEDSAAAALERGSASDDSHGEPEELAPRPQVIGAAGLDLELGSDGSEEERAKALTRRCVICFSAEISTVSLPCRHSTMCLDCMIDVKSRYGACPVCRTRVDYYLEGEFETEYVDVATFQMGRLFEKVKQQRMDFVKHAYANMWAAICIFVVGTPAAIGCLWPIITDPQSLTFAAMFSNSKIQIFVLLGFGFTIISVCCGYLPWFVGSVIIFEQNDLGQRDSLFKREDLKKPMQLAIKTFTLLIALPLSFIFFFVPYLILVVLIRPCWQVIAPSLGQCIFSCCMRCTLPVYTILIQPIERVCALLKRACDFVSNNFCRAITSVCRWINICYTTLVKPFCRFLTAACNQFYECFCVCIWNPMARFFNWAGNLLNRYFIEPVCRVFQRCFQTIWNFLRDYPFHYISKCLSHIATTFMVYVVTPIGRRAAKIGRWILDLIKPFCQIALNNLKSLVMWLKRVFADVARAFRGR